MNTENNVTVEQSNSTAVMVIENKETHEKVEILSCLFLLFVEYLGYETPFIEWAEEWCTKGNIPQYRKDILFVDAKSILNKVLKDYNLDNLHDYYNQFYAVALKKWADLLKESEK